jgi:hypothetical protein
MPAVRFHQIKAHEVETSGGKSPLGGIAQKYGVQVEHILQENPEVDPADAKAHALVGQMLVINLEHSTSLSTC